MKPDLVIVWRVTEACNLGCDFCGYSRHLMRHRRSANVEEILRFGELLAEYSVSSGRTVLVSWLGGEPRLWPPLMKVSQVFKKDFHLLESVTTNGVPLSEEDIREHLSKYYYQLTVSVDGLGPFHDWCRDAPGLFEQLQVNIARLREAVGRRGSSLILGANTILMRRNIAEFELLCDTLAEWGIQDLTFNQLGGNDRPEFYPDNRLLPHQVYWFCRELPGIRERLARRGLRIHGSERYLERIQSTTKGLPIPILDCAPGQQFLFVDEQGIVSPCSFTGKGYGIPLTSIRSLQDLMKLPEVFREMRRTRLLVPCLDCHSNQVFDKFQVECGPDQASNSGLQADGSAAS